MKKLTIERSKRNISSKIDIDYIENQFSISLDQSFKDLILEYEGCQVLEYIYYNKCVSYGLNQFLYIKSHKIGGSIEDILKGHRYYGYSGYVPFATDPGGRDFNVGINPKNYGQVWINKFDSGEDDPFEFVCDSLEKFIDSLITEKEADLLGY